ncbi:MAG: hypoxanthine phosphoribosyltransferase [Mucilaginibacter sp.]|nr:hypoxanthine phosphoribosyltransferase [Mucilaginibacter sp.]
MKIADLEFEPLIAFDAIEKRVKTIAEKLNSDYAGKTPIIVGVLNGCFLFMADLVKEITIPCEVAFTKLSSYHGGLKSSRIINDEYDLLANIEGRHVILVEDIIDTGNTLNYLIAKLEVRKPASISVCTLLLKPDALEHKIDELKYIAFEIEDVFVVGYGLDYLELGRNLKGIYKKIK